MSSSLQTKKKNPENKNETRSECPICGESLTKLYLKRHMERHDEKKFETLQKCFHCDEMFKDFLSLKAHITWKHSAFVQTLTTIKGLIRTKYTCGECNHSDAALTGLIKHYKCLHSGSEVSDNFKCFYCPVTFLSRSERAKHSSKHLDKDKNVTFNCDECPQTFETPEAFGDHFNEHYANRQYVCAHCPRRFKCTRSCMYHEKIVHADKLLSSRTDVGDGLTDDERRLLKLRRQMEHLVPGPKRDEHNKLIFECDVCGKKVAGSRQFGLHFDTHKETCRNVCNICKQGFNSQSKLRQHRVVHENKEYCKCEICGHESQDKYCHQLHINTNHGGKYKCAHCDMRFASSPTRIQHLKNTHSEDEYHLIQHANEKHEGKRYKCPTCGLVSDDRRTIRTHRINVHKEILDKKDSSVPEGASVCNICGKNVLGRMRAHMQKHEHKKDCECEKCGEKFQDEYSLRSHLRTVHTNRNICQFCDEVFGNKDFLVKHIRKNHNEKLPSQNKCKNCLERFCTINGLTSHARMHKPNTKQCLDCHDVLPDEYTFEQHVKAEHKGYKGFKCPICGSRFGRKGTLDIHRRTVHKETIVTVRSKNGNNESETDSDGNENIIQSPNATEESYENSSPSKKGIPPFYADRETTTLPMAMAISEKMRNNNECSCIAWTRKTESDLAFLVSRYPGRCFLRVLDQKQSASKKRKDDNLPRNQKVIHFVRERHYNVGKAEAESLPSKIVICNSVADINQ